MSLQQDYVVVSSCAACCPEHLSAIVWHTGHFGGVFGTAEACDTVGSHGQGIAQLTM